MILILADKFDKHADVVCNKLNQRSAKYFRFDLDTESLKKTTVTLSGGHWKIVQHNEAITLDLVEKVWARRPFVEVSLEEENINDSGFKIWRSEWNKTLLGIYHNLKSADWINSLSKAYQAENKYYQMELAREIGFKTPPLIVSNCKSDLLDFAASNDEVVMKLMAQEFYQDSDGSFKGIYVNKVTLNDLSEFNDYAENPIVLQKYIDKSYEIRYTVVGDDHHVCQIQSQKSSQANIDWRRYDIPNTPHYSVLPPDDIKKKIDTFMKVTNLKFGAFDFIVDPYGDWYFLEINAMGQWLWIEDLTGLKISESIVNILVKDKDLL